MRRLIEQPASDRLSARAQLLIRTLEPTMPSEERLQRVRRALDSAPPADTPSMRNRVSPAGA